MALTIQQSLVLSTLLQDDVTLVLTPACAGSGKTHTLIELANKMPINDGIYLAYNKSIADEAAEKFKGTKVKCLTTHSLAYRAVVRQYGLKVGYFNARDVVTQGITYKDKMLIVATLEDFLVSPMTDPAEYLKSISADEDLTSEVLHHLNLMSTGAISCSHNFYLKLYHVLLATEAIEPPSTCLLMLDEFGDTNPVTLAIFQLINARKKIAVGDSKQNIYSFNGTINGFTALAGKGTTVPLTQSFRVSAPIARRIENFVKVNLDRDFEFKGREYPDNTRVTTEAFISRNNSGLVEKMFTLMAHGEVFHTTRKIEDILELPLVLANADNGKPIKDYAYKHIEKLRLGWDGSKSLQMRYPEIITYIVEKLYADEDIERAAKVVKKHSSDSLNELVTYCNSCKSHNAAITLTTAHSSKGLEWSSVEIANDLNLAVNEAIGKIRTKHSGGFVRESFKQLEEELLLYYVACSRSMIELKNATALGKASIS